VQIILPVILLILFGALPADAIAQVKRTTSDICHDTSSQYYTRIKKFTNYSTLEACLASGARLPKRYSGPSPAADTAPSQQSQQSQQMAHAMATAQASNISYSLTYNRRDWPHWVDTDKDCQDTRAELLIAQSLATVTFRNNKACSVIGGHWDDPFSGKTWTRATDVDIDHVVPLKWANGHGGVSWSKIKKQAFANDVQNLLVVQDNLNQSKGAKGPDEWMPPNQAYRCNYVTRFNGIVAKYNLGYLASEKRTIAKMLNSCGYTIPS
jgi:hypothetical protein